MSVVYNGKKISWEIPGRKGKRLILIYVLQVRSYKFMQIANDLYGPQSKVKVKYKHRSKFGGAGKGNYDYFMFFQNCYIFVLFLYF